MTIVIDKIALKDFTGESILSILSIIRKMQGIPLKYPSYEHACYIMSGYTGFLAILKVASVVRD